MRYAIPILTAAFLIAYLTLWPGASRLDGGPAPVPAEFADLYGFLDTRLRAAERFVALRATGERHPVHFAAELLAANSNRGEVLLRDQTWQATMLNLDRLQALGVKAIGLAVNYPILVPSFPRSAEYLAFYRRLAQERRRRNLRLFVGATTTFREPVFASLPVDYTGLTLQRYMQEKRQMVEVIVREIRPDYLSLENEPGTQEKNTGLSFTVRNVTAIMQHLLAGLDRQGVLIGAGAGSWDDLAYIENLAQHTAIDFVDFHVYPINRDYLIDRTFRIADIARRHNKRIAVGEAWLYKARDQELGGTIAQAADIFARDVYGLWEPLDVRFITVLGSLSHALRIDLISFFWMRHFFAYVEYTDSTRRMGPARLFDLANREVARSMMGDPPILTQTGLAFQRLAAGGAR